VLEAFIEFREEVILRRTAYDLAKARERAHILVGLAVAVANIDEVIELIRAAPDPATAKAGLLERAWPAEAIRPLLALVEGEEAAARAEYRLSERQAQAILDLRLQRLTGLEREKITGELKEIAKAIEELLLILQSRERLLEVMKEELAEVRAKFADERRTFIDLDAELDIDIEDLIPREDMVVTVTHKGYIKRVPVSTFRAQRRGGKGRAGMRTHEDDFVSRLFVANTHTPVLFFSSLGRVYKLKVYKLPLGNPQARGKAMINLFPHLSEGEWITAILPLPEDEASWAELSAVFATSRGKVRRNDLADFTRVPVTGKIAMGLDEGDRLIGVDVCDESHDILLATAAGKAIRFPVESLRVFRSRTSEGVRGIDLAQGDEVISMSILDHMAFTTEERDELVRIANARRRAAAQEDNGDEPGADQPALLASETVEAMLAKEQLILAVTLNGFGKRTSAFEYRVTNRGGQGIINIETSERNGAVAATFPVAPTDHLMLVTDKGKTIRIPVEGIRVAGRKTQGVTLFSIDEGEHVVSVARLADAGETEEDGEDEEG
jgi:DNA gyrase subunit A